MEEEGEVRLEGKLKKRINQNATFKLRSDEKEAMVQVTIMFKMIEEAKKDIGESPHIWREELDKLSWAAIKELENWFERFERWFGK
jgi:hypothetical protein